MHVVKGMVPEIGGYEGAGNEAANAVNGYLGHKPGMLAMHWNAAAVAEAGELIPMKALIAAVAVKGLAAVKAMLALGAAEMAAAY